MGERRSKKKHAVALHIKLTKSDDDSLKNELELEPKFRKYMDVESPHVEIQLQLGRDAASLIETAANKWYSQHYNSGMHGPEG